MHWVGDSRRPHSEAGYGLVLVVIAVTYVASVATDTPLVASIVVILQLVALHVILTVGRAPRRYLLAVDTAVILAAALAVVVAVQGAAAQSHAPLVQVVFWISAGLYAFAPLLLIQREITRPTVDTRTLLAAIAAYLMIGMFFAFTYRALAASQDGPFFGSSGEGTVSDDLFFSFITLTTTGYGDLVPAGNPGQTLAAVEAIAGELFLVTAVAKVVNQSGVLSRRRRAATGSDPATPDDGP